MNKGTIGVVLALVILIGVAIAYFALNNSSGSGVQNGSSNQSTGGQLASDPNFFAGNVTTEGIPVGTYNGTGVYDHNCLPIGNGIYSCDAGIKTAEYGTIDFAYKHDMMMKPCLGPGQTVVVKVLDGSGAATVQRTSSSAGYN